MNNLKKYTKYFLLTILSGYLYTPGLQAYIPSTSFILQKVAENNGRRPIEISYNVSINSINGQSYTLKEKWTSLDGKKLILNVTSDNFNLNRLYLGSQSFDKVNSRLTKRNNPTQFIEKIFFLDNWGNILNILIRKKIIAPQLKSTAYQTKGSRGPVYISRIKDDITYTLMLNEDSSLEKNISPGIWISQENHVIRRVKLDEDTEWNLSLETFENRGHKIAKEKSLSWPNGAVRFQLVDTRILPNTTKTKNLFSPSLFSKAQENSVNTISDQNVKNIVSEFYQRFR